MTPQDTMRLALELLDRQWQCSAPWSLEEAQDVAEALRSALSQQGEPVAWQWLDTANFRKNLPKDAIKEHWRPLYAGAAPAAQPLTDEQIDELRFSVTAQHHTERARKLVRLVERHHGIGAAPAAQPDNH